MSERINRHDFKILFETGALNDHANAVVLREADDTDRGHIWRTKLFQMACVIGLLDGG